LRQTWIGVSDGIYKPFRRVKSDVELEGGAMTCRDQVEVTKWQVILHTKENMSE
jgi:hypothetical protein